MNDVSLFKTKLQILSNRFKSLKLIRELEKAGQLSKMRFVISQIAHKFRISFVSEQFKTLEVLMAKAIFSTIRAIKPLQTKVWLMFLTAN